MTGDQQRLARRRGVTLIEVLVAISVIAVLLGITLPALIGARSAADASLCLSNLRTIGTAFALYTADHRDAWPTYPFQRDPDGVIRQELLLEWWFATPDPPDEVGAQIFVLPTDQVQIWSHPLRTYVSEEAEDAPYHAEQIVSCPVVYREAPGHGVVADPAGLAGYSFLQSPAFFTRQSVWVSGASVSINRDYDRTLVTDVAHPSNKALLVERFSHHSGRRDAITMASPMMFNVLAADGHAAARRGDQARPARPVDGQRAGGLPCAWCGVAVPYVTTEGGVNSVDW